MRLRVIVVVALVLGIFSVPAFAQIETGVKGGVGFASVSSEIDELEELLPDSRTGIIFGAFVEVPFTNWFSLVVEGLYNQKGAKGEFQTVKYDVFEIPFLLNVPINTNSNIRPFVYGGVAPAFRLSSKVEFESGGEEDLDDELKGSDVSVVFGGGVKFGLFGVEARYNLGVTDVNEESFSEGSIKSRQFAILGSITFPRR